MKILSTGGFSTILYPYNNNNEVGKLIYVKKNNIGYIENEVRITELIYNIENNNKYYSTFILEKKELIKLDSSRFDKLKEVLIKDKYYEPKINNSLYLLCYPLKYCGIDMFYLINDVIDFDFSLWENNIEYKIYSLIKHLLEGLFFLHENKITHFDIKPENIVYNSEGGHFGERFKIIDFGLSNTYPFTNYIEKGPFGTQEFIPKEFDREICFPNSKPNDWTQNAGPDVFKKYIHIASKTKEYNLIYKTDIYALGMSIYNLIYYLNYNTKLLDKLLKNMVHDNIYLRYTAQQCLDDDYCQLEVTKHS